MRSYLGPRLQLLAQVLLFWSPLSTTLIFGASYQRIGFNHVQLQQLQLKMPATMARGAWTDFAWNRNHWDNQRSSLCRSWIRRGDFRCGEQGEPRRHLERKCQHLGLNQMELVFPRLKLTLGICRKSMILLRCRYTPSCTGKLLRDTSKLLYS